MFADGIFPIGDGLLDIDDERLKSLLVPHDINEVYDVEQTPFARGKFAAVRRAIHKNSGTHFAAKFLKRRRRAQSSDKEIKHEIAVLMLCNEADNIVKLNAVHESRSDIALLLELATGGELQTFLDNEEYLTEAQGRICMREVLKAIQFLHKRSIVHLDLKPQNILLSGELIEDGLKLCDFGISRVVTEGTNVREIVGTPDYVAPEVLQYEPLSLCTDIWSVGVLAYVLLSGFSPFGGETKQETFLNISQCSLTFPDKLFKGVSPAAIDFIRRALRIKPSDRMTADECLGHIWLKDECNIDRHIFNAIKYKRDLEQEESSNKEHDNEDYDHDNGVGDIDENRENDEILQGNVGNELKLVKVKLQAYGADSTKKDNDILHNALLKVTDETATKTCYVNGHTSFHSAACFKKLREEKSIKHTSVRQTNISIKKTIAVHDISNPETVTVPLCVVHPTISAQQLIKLQEQQFLHIPARRNSSESNKENTFVTTKKITAVNCNGSSVSLKKSSSSCLSSAVTQSATATIHISPPSTFNAANNVVATIKIPTSNAVNVKYDKVSVTNGSHHSLFPDAPTTPKVIRKTPTADTSSTSVKALVKKFQLEGGEQPITPPEFITNGSRMEFQLQSTKNPSQLKFNGNASRDSISTLTIAHSSAITIANSARRASVPISHNTYKKQSMISSSAPVSVPTSQNCHTTCLYCVTSTNSLTDGCRHPNPSTNNIEISLKDDSDTVDKNFYSITPLSSNSTKSLINDNTSNDSLIFPTSNNAAISSSQQTLIFGQEEHSHSHQLQRSHPSHHYHNYIHHHGIIKNATNSPNGLSLDQGIIC